MDPLNRMFSSIVSLTCGDGSSEGQANIVFIHREDRHVVQCLRGEAFQQHSGLWAAQHHLWTNVTKINQVRNRVIFSYNWTFDTIGVACWPLEGMRVKHWLLFSAQEVAAWFWPPVDSGPQRCGRPLWTVGQLQQDWSSEAALLWSPAERSGDQKDLGRRGLGLLWAQAPFLKLQQQGNDHVEHSKVWVGRKAD